MKTTILLVSLSTLIGSSVLLLWNTQHCSGPSTALSGNNTGAGSADMDPYSDAGERIASQLAGALRIPTISTDDGHTHGAAFLALHDYLAAQFPLVHEQLTVTPINRYSLLYEWRGTSSKNPVLLMAHMDVVPANADEWSHPPFGGARIYGTLWGRGALDDKASLIAILHAAESLLARGYQPERTIYFAFGHDEEIGGKAGALQIAAHLRSRKLRFAAILDEGGGIAKGFFPGLQRTVASIGPAEKGYLTLKLTSHGDAGHSSMPAQSSAINDLTRALNRLLDAPFPADYSLLGPLMRSIASELTLVQRLTLCNDGVFAPLLKRLLSKTPALDATMRTTIAITELQAGFKENVVPGTAEATLNLRLIPGASIAETIAHVERAIADPRISISTVPGAIEASPVSPVDSTAYRWIANSVRHSSHSPLPPLVAPRLVTGATDSRHVLGLSDKVYRFAPITVTPETIASIHGVDEQIRIEDLVSATRFYAALMRSTEMLE